MKDILDELNHAPEDVKADVHYHLNQYRADCLARPNAERGEVLKALLRSRLAELLKAWKRTL